MRKKYTYFAGDKELSRKDFMHELKKHCQKVVSTDVIAGWCGVDFCEFDEKKFNKYMRSIEKGNIVVLYNSNKAFRRKEVAQ